MEFTFQSAILALDGTILDVDQVENLIKFCPNKEEMDLLKVCIYDLFVSVLFKKYSLDLCFL